MAGKPRAGRRALNRVLITRAEKASAQTSTVIVDAHCHSREGGNPVNVKTTPVALFGIGIEIPLLRGVDA